MRKLPLFTGIVMFVLQFLILGIYATSKANISAETWNFGVVIVMLVLINLTALTLILFGVFNKE